MINKREMLRQIADHTSDPSFVMGLSALPNPDEVLRKAGLSHEVYSQVLTDPHVMSKVIDRRSGMLKREWTVEAGDDSAAAKMVADLCSAVLADMEEHEEYPLENSLGVLQEAAFRGHRAVEVSWVYDGYWKPAFLRDIPGRRLIHTGVEWKLLTIDNPSLGIPFPDKKVLLAAHMATTDNPYGEALLSRCFWPYMFKHSGFTWWVTLAEKYGLPWIIGKLGGATEEAQRRDLLNKLVALVVDAVAVLPKDAEFDFKNDQGVSPEVHEKLINICNGEISKVLVGQTLSTEITGDTGSRAAAETHSDLRDEIVEADSKMVARVMNRLFGWISEINFGPGVKSPKFKWVEEDKPNKTWAEVAGMAIENLPGQVPLRWAWEKYGIPEDMKGEEMVPVPKSPTQKTAQPSSESFAGNGDGEDFTEEQQRLEALAMKGIVMGVKTLQVNEHKILEAVHSSSSYEEAMEKLLELYPHLESEPFAEILQQVFVSAEMFGRHTVEAESE